MKRLFASFTILVLLALPDLAQRPAAAPPQPSTHHAVKTAPAPSADAVWADLMEGNKRFMAGKPKARQLVSLRATLANDQHPKVIVLSCSDSRVAPELVFDKSLGELFVVRSAGNIADAIGVGSIEYAVEHLGSSLLVVMGHTKCGAVTAACSGEKMPSASLQTIVDRISPAVASAAKSAKGNELIEAAIIENVHRSAQDVLASSEILQHFVADGKLKVIEAEYRLDTGAVVRLDKAQH